MDSNNNDDSVEDVMFNVIRNDLKGEEWRKIKVFWNNEHVNTVGYRLITICSKEILTLPYQFTNSKLYWDDSLAKTFWERFYLLFYTQLGSYSLSKRFNTKNSKKQIVWETEGNPDTYDMDKVLEELGEVELGAKKKKPKDKKTKKSKTACREVKEHKVPIEFTEPQELSKPFKTIEKCLTQNSNTEIPQNQDQDPLKKDINPTNPKVNGKCSELSKSNYECIEEYIDSLEQQIRCLKMSQQFYDSL